MGDPSPLQRPRNSRSRDALEAVLSMDISDLNGADLEDLPEEPVDDVFPNGDSQDQTEMPAGGRDSTGEVIAGGRRRRRRGGRGRGRRRLDGAEDGAAATDAGGTPADPNESAPVGVPGESANPNADYSDARNSISEKDVWASAYEREEELPHADSGPSTHREGDSSI